MCGAAIPVIATAAQFAGQAVSAVTEAQAQNADSKQAIAAAIENATRSYRALNDRAVEEQKATSRNVESATRQTDAAVSTAKTSAGESGVGGLSVHALANDYARGLSEFKDSEQQALDLALAQIAREKEAVRISSQNTIDAHPPANPFNTALKIGGAAIGAAASFTSMAAPNSSTVSGDVVARANAAAASYGAPRLADPIKITRGN